MIIGGFQKFSLVDYPEKLSAIVFTQGCNFLCPYCHNPELNSFGDRNILIKEQYIIDFLETRIGKIDAVVISGGEPTCQNDLIDFIKRIKCLGFLIKLDTNGSNPEIIEQLLTEKLIDYIAMDIKTSPEKYFRFSKDLLDFNKIKKSIQLIMQSNVDYEFRTTVVKDILSIDDILKIGQMIKGAKKYYLQKFVPTKLLDADYSKAQIFNDEEFSFLQKELEKHIKNVNIR